MNVQKFLARIISDLQEEESWTQEELIGNLNSAESEFLRQTGILKTDTTINATTLLVDRPDLVIDIDRVSFNGKPLRRQTSWDLEREDRSWRAHSVGTPSYWHEDNISADKIELNKIPAGGGSLRIFADSRFTPYTSPNDTLHVSDTWEPYIRWRVLGLILGRDGDHQDLARSQYANSRFHFGVYLARRLMTGNPSLTQKS